MLNIHSLFFPLQKQNNAKSAFLIVLVPDLVQSGIKGRLTALICIGKGIGILCRGKNHKAKKRMITNTKVLVYWILKWRMVKVRDGTIDDLYLNFGETDG